MSWGQHTSSCQHELVRTRTYPYHSGCINVGGVHVHVTQHLQRVHPFLRSAEMKDTGTPPISHRGCYKDVLSMHSWGRTRLCVACDGGHSSDRVRCGRGRGGAGVACPPCEKRADFLKPFAECLDASGARRPAHPVPAHARGIIQW